MTTPQTFVPRPVRVEAMQYRADTCRALHAWLGWEHTDEAPCDSWIEVQLPDGETVQLRPGGWVFVDPATREIVDALTDDECRARYVPAGAGGAKAWDRWVFIRAVMRGTGGECSEDEANALADVVESALPDAGAGLALTDEAGTFGHVESVLNAAAESIDAYIAQWKQQESSSVLSELRDRIRAYLAGQPPNDNPLRTALNALERADQDHGDARICDAIAAVRAVLAGQEG